MQIMNVVIKHYIDFYKVDYKCEYLRIPERLTDVSQSLVFFGKTNMSCGNLPHLQRFWEAHKSAVIRRD